MINWIRKLFNDCEHKWVIIREISIRESEGDKLPYASVYVLQCEKCGDLKQVKIS